MSVIAKDNYVALEYRLWLDSGEQLRGTPEAPAGLRRLAWAITALVALMVVTGGFVAGIRAGRAYNTFPLMNGHIVPPEILMIDPWWENLFSNMATVQFDHRLLAYVVVVLVAGYAYIVQTRTAAVMVAAVLLQVVLGIWTLLWQVPLELGLVHQGGALIVLAAALWNLHAVLMKSPGPDRR